jgi:hypothetical protein
MASPWPGGLADIPACIALCDDLGGADVFADAGPDDAVADLSINVGVAQPVLFLAVGRLRVRLGF